MRQKLVGAAQASFARCAQQECPQQIRQECASASAKLRAVPWLDKPMPGPNLAVALTLDSGPLRVATRRRRLQRATYSLTAAGLVVGGWAIASGLRGRQIDNACASEASCSEGYAAHGRMLYRSADAGAVIGGLCGVGAVIMLWQWLTMPSPAGFASANAAGAAPSSWQLTF